MIFTLFGIVCAIACYKIAHSKGRNPRIWAVIGLLTNAIAVVVVLLLPNLLIPLNHKPGTNIFIAVQNSILAFWTTLKTNFKKTSGRPRIQVTPGKPYLSQHPIVTFLNNLQIQARSIFRSPQKVSSLATQIRVLAQLRDDGHITDIEYQDKKQKLLDTI